MKPLRQPIAVFFAMLALPEGTQLFPPPKEPLDPSSFRKSSDYYRLPTAFLTRTILRNRVRFKFPFFF